MRSSNIFVLVALVGALYLVLGDAPEPIEEAESMSELVPDPSTTSTTADVRVLSESATAITPDTDLYGNPVEDHYSITTTTTTTTATTTTVAKNTDSTAKKSTPVTTTSTLPENKSPPSTTAVEPGFDAGTESSFASKINSLRSSKGMAALSRSGQLDSEARSWAKTLGERGKLAHSSIGRLLPPWSAAAENVASGGDVSSMFSSLSGSGGHLSNMVGDYTHMGIGAWIDSTGRIWTVHVFAR